MRSIRPAKKEYTWGTREVIPGILGEAPTREPYAEAWYGTHPAGPSLYLDTGRRVRQDIPYMLKLLSAARPLSIQAHPDKETAQREYAAGNPLYSDANHKPETIVALEGGMEARAGMRDEEGIDRIVGLSGSRKLLEIWQSDEAAGSAELFAYQLLTLNEHDRVLLVEHVVSTAQNSGLGYEDPDELRWLNECAKQYYTKKDIGIVLQMLMNYVRLEPGMGLHVPAGVLHAYLRGTVAEVMACSDNVLRGGLTEKGLAVEEIARVGALKPATPFTDSPSNGVFRQAGVSDYTMRHLVGDGYAHLSKRPTIVLALGDVSINEHLLHRGEAVLLRPHERAEIRTSNEAFIVC